MSSIGPQLPPHLSKRKRTPDDEGEADSPPSKRAPSNQDEIALDDDDSDDDGFGPVAPKASTLSIGPTLAPPNLTSKPAMGPSSGPSRGPTLPPSNTNEISLEDSDDDSDAGPAPAVASIPQPPKRVLGPAPPPASLSERPSYPPAADSASDSDDDDDYGPALPTSSSHQERQSQARALAALAAANPKAPQRDDWMLAPPTSSNARAADPTNIKARKFNSAPRGGGPSTSGSEVSSIWTETPEQKRKRLENAVLGRSDASNPSAGGPAGGGGGGGPAVTRTREEDERAEQIRRNLEAARGPSLYDEHQRREGGKGGRIEEEEDDPSKRAFDREKDMKLGGRIGTAQRRELLNKAGDFGGRFSKGKFL